MTAGPNDATEPKRRPRSKESAMPVNVMILTPDHEIQGVIYVSRDAQEHRRITDLLNDADRRFLAVTDARLINRVGPSTPRLYSFLQLHIDNIIMIHPSVQAVVKDAHQYTPEEAQKFNTLRHRFNQPDDQKSSA